MLLTGASQVICRNCCSFHATNLMMHLRAAIAVMRILPANMRIPCLVSAPASGPSNLMTIPCRNSAHGQSCLTTSASSRMKSHCPLGRVTHPTPSHQQHRTICTSSALSTSDRKKDPPGSRVMRKEYLFQESEVKDKSSFMLAIDMYTEMDRLRRGHVEFIYTAMKFMEEFGVERDLESYKKLFEVFPKEKMIATNMFQTEFMHYPTHQQCAIDVLDQMESHGVMPDKELSSLILERFGSRSYVYRKYCRMMYWMPKFKNASPFPLPDPLPPDVLDLARLAVQRISVDLQTKVTVHQADELDDSLDKTWIVSGQSPQQQRLIEEHPAQEPIYVEGPFRIWLRRTSLSYFILRADAKPLPESEEDVDDVSSIPAFFFGLQPEPKELVKKRTVHEQEDGTIFATCCTGTSSRDSLLSWIRFLQRTNPKLEKIPVVFTLKAPSQAVSDSTVNETTPQITEGQKQLPEGGGRPETER